jgi:NADH-quinone oxidoreductase subunit J
MKGVLLYFFISLSALSALAVLFSKNILYAAILFVICLLGIAGIYLLLQAELLGVSQILIYAGGVLVIIIFGVMLTPGFAERGNALGHQNKIIGTAIAVTLLGVLARHLEPLPFSGSVPHPSVAETGISIFIGYLAPFELAGILLLVSLIGAIVICTHKLSEKSGE